MKTFTCRHCPFTSTKHDAMFRHWHDTHAGNTLNRYGNWGPELDNLERNADRRDRSQLELAT